MQPLPLPNIVNQDQLLKVIHDGKALVTLTPDCFNDGILDQLLSQLDSLVFNLNRVQTKALMQWIKVSGLKL